MFYLDHHCDDFFLLVSSYTPTAPVQSIGQTCSFSPLVSKYVKDAYVVLRCCTIVHTIYARPTPKRVCAYSRVLFRYAQILLPYHLSLGQAGGMVALPHHMYCVLLLLHTGMTYLSNNSICCLGHIFLLKNSCY